MTGPDGFVAVDRRPVGFDVLRLDAKRYPFAKPNWLWLTGRWPPPLEIDVRHKSERKRKAGTKGAVKSRAEIPPIKAPRKRHKTAYSPVNSKCA
jgi:hypothetical protein